MSTVLFNNTVLRDGHQSLAATRMTTAQMLPAAPILDEMGFAGLETWGGATIDSCLRYLNENPFDRLRALKKAAPKTPQIMLLRGQNIVQYTSFPDDVVEAFVRANAAAGQDIFRIFDALNDVRNLRTAIKTVLACGKHARGEVCYTTSPVHTVKAFVEMGIELREMGCHSIGIKDMSGVIAPRVAYDMVKELKARVGLPVTLHTHDTAGLGAASYLAAIDAGVDAVETSIVPFANGTSQPDTLRMLALLDGHPRCPKFDTKKLQQLREYFTGVYKELEKFTSPANERVDSDTLIYQVPGGMLSNFRTQLKEQNMSDKFEQVMAEIPYVRSCLGWIPLVTPTSQIVGTQAMLNVKFGRWTNFSQPAMDIALGKYGRTPGPIDPSVRELAIKKSGQQTVECRPADLLAPRMSKLREELAAGGLPTDDEACVLHAMFPREFAALHKKSAAPAAASAPAAAAAAQPAPAAAPAVGAPSAPMAPGQVQHFVLTVGGVRKTVQVQEIS
ncbi:pyruvate carboxylase subunit B [Opitutus terrae]|uniref:Pyruvate carboxyltransferase n=1 Tax=Opitutus terrae (strain DSM 11246 / JCM 15787 / PB90-1) TaxID=452637 RepID=B1ZTE1_OPITP|nr:pyruvate carboxylase subunit B [Opitutus terrae]ACB76595.1 pyruvate carboxyltransferase [Opitutus terrae PB90-1]